MLLVELDVVLTVLISVLVWEQEREVGREGESERRNGRGRQGQRQRQKEAKKRREGQEGLDEETVPRVPANLEAVQLVCAP